MPYVLEELPRERHILEHLPANNSLVSSRSEIETFQSPTTHWQFVNVRGCGKRLSRDVNSFGIPTHLLGGNEESSNPATYVQQFISCARFVSFEEDAIAIKSLSRAASPDHFL
jgi:hypothetical protein